MKNISCLVVIALILFPVCVNAEIKIIKASHTYKMGDNDSRNDARHMCFLEAKRIVLEKAGTYIESHTKIRNYRLAKDEISAYSAALLKVETIDEKWEDMALTLTVKAEVDTRYIEKQLSKIKQDTSVQKKIKDQQSRLQELERTVVKLQKQLATVDAPKAATLRKERNVVFKRIDKIQARKIAIVTKIKSTTKDALKLIERGMTEIEVISLIGQPRSRGWDREWNYGNVWIIFEQGIVGCIVRSKCFKHRYYCKNHLSSCIVK